MAKFYFDLKTGNSGPVRDLLILDVTDEEYDKAQEWPKDTRNFWAVTRGATLHPDSL